MPADWSTLLMFQMISFRPSTPSGVVANCDDSSSTLEVSRGLSMTDGPATAKAVPALFPAIQRSSRSSLF